MTDSLKSTLSSDVIALIDALPDATAVVDAAGVVVASSRTAQQKLGWSSEIRIRLNDLLPAEAAAKLISTETNDSPVHATLDTAKHGTQEFNVTSHSLAIGKDFKLIVCREASSHEKLLDFVAENQWFETCAALAGGLAHNFNNSLASILGLSELIGLKIPEDDPLAQFPPKIGLAVERARGLVTRLSQMSRKATGDVKAEPTAMIVEEIRPVLEAFLPANTLLETTIDPETPWSKVDRHAFEHVLLNCLGFARRHTREGGGRAVLNCGPGNPPDTAEITISCDGPQIQNVDTSKLFDLDLTPTATAYESGAGLFVAKRVAENFGASLTAESPSPGGVIFRIALPGAPRDSD